MLTSSLAPALPQKQTRTYQLSLLRAILRECTYLPDPESRTYVHARIISRYREHLSKAPESVNPTSSEERSGKDRRRNSPKPLDEHKWTERIKNNTKNARKTLSFLARANAGEIKALEKVLMQTYGRSGKRRHELLAPLREPDTPSNATHLETLAAQSKRPSSQPRPPHQPISTKLQALIDSQIVHRPPELTKATRIKHAKPIIPETNSWLRSLPRKRADNLKRKWYGDVLERLLPPIPDSEYIRLKELATGVRSWVGAPRRSGAVEGFETRVEGETATEPTASAGGLVNGDEALGGQSDEFGAGIEDDDEGEGQGQEEVETGFLEKELAGRDSHPARNYRTKPHHLTPRLMRRLWAKVLSQCPRMSWDHDKNAWQVEWGDVEAARAEREPVAKGLDQSLFEGVDLNGKIIAQEKVGAGERVEQTG